MRVRLLGTVAWTVLSLLGPAELGRSQVPFDFSNRWYFINGIDARQFVARIQIGDVNGVRGVPPDLMHNSTRITEVNGGYDAAGTLLYYPAPPATFTAAAFLPNAAGAHAHMLANKFRAFLFPRRAGNPLDPSPPNRRHDNVFDTSSGYRTANPLGLWRLTFPRYTDAALFTPEGQAKLDEIRARNGSDLDGTPIIRRLSEINELESLGFLELNQRPEDGSAGFPWVV